MTQDIYDPAGILGADMTDDTKIAFCEAVIRRGEACEFCLSYNKKWHRIQDRTPGLAPQNRYRMIRPQPVEASVDWSHVGPRFLCLFEFAGTWYLGLEPPEYDNDGTATFRHLHSSILASNYASFKPGVYPPGAEHKPIWRPGHEPEVDS